MKLLVTGKNGLVGSAINADVKIGREFNLEYRECVEEMFHQHTPTHVIHTAGKVGGVGGNMNHMGEFFYDNMMINMNVINSAKMFGVKKVLSFLSTCIFPDVVEYPITEDKIHFGPPHPSNFGYAYAKRMVDVMNKAYNLQYGTKYISVIPTNIYGPNDNYNLNNGHVIPSLIHKCYLAKKNKTDFVIWGTGEPVREFIYSEDVAKIVERLVVEYEDEEPIIISTCKQFPIKYIAELIAQSMKFNGKIILDKSKPDGQFRKPSSNKKFQRLYPNFKYTHINDGIEKSVEWFCSNYPNVRGVK